MGVKGQIVDYKYCIQDANGKDIQNLYNLFEGEFKFDQESIALAKASGEKPSHPQTQTKSIQLVKACPKGATATCAKNNVVEYYYTDSNRILDEHETSCGYSGSDIWTIYN